MQLLSITANTIKLWLILVKEVNAHVSISGDATIRSISLWNSRHSHKLLFTVSLFYRKAGFLWYEYSLQWEGTAKFIL